MKIPVVFHLEGLSITQTKAGAETQSLHPGLQVGLGSPSQVAKGRKSFAPDSAAAIFSSFAVAFWNFLVLH